MVWGAKRMGLQSALHALQTDKDFMRHVTAWHVLPPRPGREAPWPSLLDARLRAVAQNAGVRALYAHQAAAIESVLRGHDVVVVTPTASGKSLVYVMLLLQVLLHDPHARGLLLYPTKALAQDQRQKLQGWLAALGLPDCTGVYDGDTPVSARGRIRRTARLLITNPDMLHHSILPHHTRWADFWRGLRYIVLDEVHAYRGIFGAHVANVLRRLRRVVAFYQGNGLSSRGEGGGWEHVRFISTSATVGNPGNVVERLTGRSPVVISENAAPQPPRTLIFYNPPLLDPATGLRRNVLLEARRIALHFLRHGVQTVVFVRSRRSVEVLLGYLRDAVQEIGVQPDAIRGYRAGYLPSTRREIERGLREGRIALVVATNALELGVDIGTLGASILVGYPGSISATWQQVGRAGRSDEGGASVLIASSTPLDQYIVTHPDFVLNGTPEHVLLEPDNLHVLLAHMRCALFEQPFGRDEHFGAFGMTSELLQFLSEMGEARAAGSRYHWIGEGYPAEDISLRTAASDRVTIVVEAEGRRASLGEVDRASAPRMVHPGAIYLHDARSYLVERVDWGAGVATVRPVDVDYYTVPAIDERLTVLNVWQEEAVKGTTRALGEVRVHTQVTGYRKVRWYTHEVLGREEVEVPAQELETTAYWLTFSSQVLDELRQRGLWRSDAIGDYGPNWARQRQRALARDGYRCRRCGQPHTRETPLHVHHIRPFRTFGYIPGVNDAYREANRLDNLITLCPRCHRLAETSARLRTGFSGVAYALATLAPLFVMAAPGDIGQVVEAQATHTGMPTITLYDTVPGGVGLAERLYEVHVDLLQAAWERVRECDCEHGCPGCVGPVVVTESSPNGEDEVDTKMLALALLETALGIG